MLLDYPAGPIFGFIDVVVSFCYLLQLKYWECLQKTMLSQKICFLINFLILCSWGSASLYLGSRVSQVLKVNNRGSAEGLSMAMVSTAILANSTYGVSVLMRLYSWFVLSFYALVWPPSSEFVPTWISYLLEIYTRQFDPGVIFIHFLCVTWCWWSSSNCIILCHDRQDFLGKAPWLIGSLGTVTLDITLLVQVCSWTCFTFFFP